MKVTDMPTTEKGKHFSGEAKDLYDSIYKDAMDDLKLERQMKKEMEEERKKEEEKKKKKALAAMIDMHDLYQDVVMFWESKSADQQYFVALAHLLASF